MLSKNKRLNLKTDFKWVTSGKRVESKFMTLFIKMGDPSAHLVNSGQVGSGPKIGIATSSKVFKKAHDRNRARRLVSTAFESLISPLRLSEASHLSSTINILALPKQGVLSVKSGDILLDLEEVLRKESKVI